jgi:periplasmic divalent cation tolerance protein
LIFQSLQRASSNAFQENTIEMSAQSSSILVVLCTCSGPEEARRISRHLVEGRLAACVNILGPIESIYRWNDAVEAANEVLLVVKTSSDRFPALKSTILELHSYDVPEVIALPVQEGSEPYLAWLLGQL